MKGNKTKTKTILTKRTLRSENSNEIWMSMIKAYDYARMRDAQH